MRIRLDSEVLETACRGCLCHDLPMQFGDGDCCAECGCPKTVEAFHRLKHQSKPWRLRLICCGREDGFEYFNSWTEADAFRLSYCAADGHDRQAVLSRTEGGTP